MVRVKEVAKQLRPFVKPVLIVFGIIMLGMLAILRANFSYMDDLARTVEGYKGWGNFSRYLSNFLAVFLFGNSTLTDISPWGQIVAAFLMAVNGVMLLYIIYGRKEFRWWELVVVATLALNPYFLQCLSYKFDAPFMAVAVFGGLMPLAVWRATKESETRKRWSYVMVVLAGTLVTCMTYQAALGILPMVTVVVAARMWNQKEKWGKIWRFVLETVVGYGIGLVIFKVFIMKLVDAYVVTEVPGLTRVVPQVVENLKQYYQLVMADFAKIWLVVIAVVMVWFVIMMIVDAKQRKWLAGAVGMVAVIALGMLCFGIYVVMEKPLFDPRAMLGVGVMICLLMVVVAEERKVAKKWQKGVCGVGVVAAVVLAYLFGIFGFTYGNALALQKDWTDFRIEEVVTSLDGVVQEGDAIMTAGTIGLAPALRTAVEQYPVLARLVPMEYEAGYWGQYKFFWYYGLEDVMGDTLVVPAVEEYEVVEDGQYHRLRRRGNIVVVELKEKQ